MADDRKPDRFWEDRPLGELSEAEWESLCDGCGRCCLMKLEDEDSGEIYYTNIACELLDTDTCRCRDYAHRQARIPGCLKITPESLPKLAGWLPATCAYRRLAEGKRLLSWHPLVSGSPGSVHRARISVRGRVISETEADDPEHHLVSWVW